MENKIHEEDFWDNHESAQKILKEKKSLEDKLNELKSLEDGLSDINVMIEMAEESESREFCKEIEESFDELNKKIEAVRIKTLLNGPYDANNAIISVHAGSGGLDAQDWAEMVMRMYIRWGEKMGYKVKMLDNQYADEGGIKSATLSVEGENAYGYLKNERGVHRIVRISPYDSSGRRHTSFASLDVAPEIDEDIEVEINPDDIRVDTFRSSGAGGQLLGDGRRS